jgi:hypothetical protein
MINRRFIIISGAAAALAAGAGGAIAATAQDDQKKAEQTVLADAAKRLDVSADKLRAALSAAEDAQLDQAVKDGKLTQAQADAIKQARKQRGTVLDFGRGRGGPGHHEGPGFGHGPGGDVVFPAAAKALGLTEAQLRQQLGSGKSIADVAKAENKSLSDVKAAIKDAITKQLDADVKAGRLTAAQRDRMVAEVDRHIDRLVQSKPGDRHGGPGDHDGDGDGFHGPPPGGPMPPNGTAAPSSAPAGPQAS